MNYNDGYRRSPHEAPLNESAMALFMNTESRTVRTKEPMPEHWYLTIHTRCPVCDSFSSERKRVYGKKPTEQEFRVRVDNDYDNCDEDHIY